MAIGVLLLARTPERRRQGRRPALFAAAAGALVVSLVGLGVRLDEGLLASGVFRSGRMPEAGRLETPFYRDGRTATVSVQRGRDTGTFYLATNGKMDASLGPEWRRACDAAVPPATINGDAATQALLPLVALAHRPSARTAAVIGYGSGMSTHFLLAGPRMDRVVTIEIEPQMVAGARAFYPSNRRAVDDPRSVLAIDDAKSYFASEHRQYDLILSEPSNPWVSGVSGLFTTEFYDRVRGYLTDDGVFGQWLHAYELDDALVLSVLAAIHQNFRSYEVYLVSGGDLLVVASNQPRLPRPDWSVFGTPALRDDLCRFRPFTADALDNLRLAGRAELGPLLEAYPQPNSDFYPVLDLGAEQRRYRKDFAVGFYALSADWFNLLASMTGRRLGPATDPLPALPESPRVRARALDALLRRPPVSAPADSFIDPGIREATFALRQWETALASPEAPTDWELWVQEMSTVDRYRRGSTALSGGNPFHRATPRAGARPRGGRVPARGEHLGLRAGRGGGRSVAAARADATSVDYTRRAARRGRDGQPAHRTGGRRPAGARHPGAVQRPPPGRPAQPAARFLRRGRGARPGHRAALRAGEAPAYAFTSTCSSYRLSFR
jgi:spermidine synthase